MDFCNSVASRSLVVGRDVVVVVECGSCAELIALAVALHLLLNFDFEQIAKNDEAKRGGREWEREGSGSVSAVQGVGGCGVASEQQSLDCGIVDCQHLVEGA